MAPRFFHGPARWLEPESPLTSSERLVLAVLCLWTDRSTGQCFPKVETIAAHAALSERTVRSALPALARAGAITIRRRRTEQGLSIASVYTVLGFDPTARELAAMGEPIAALQPLQGGLQESALRGANRRLVGVHQLPTNVVKANEAINTAPARADDDPDGSPHTRAPSGPMTLHGRPIPEMPLESELVPVEAARAWRDQLRAVGVGPKAVASRKATA